MVVYSAYFVAGHRLEGHPGRCRRPHGHNYAVRVWVEGPLGANNMVIDYYELKRLVDSILDEIDHSMLNEVLRDPNPTSELLAEWLAGRIGEKLPEGLRVARVEVCETPDFCAVYEP